MSKHFGTATCIWNSFLLKSNSIYFYFHYLLVAQVRCYSSSPLLSSCRISTYTRATFTISTSGDYDGECRGTPLFTYESLLQPSPAHFFGSALAGTLSRKLYTVGRGQPGNLQLPVPRSRKNIFGDRYFIETYLNIKGISLGSLFRRSRHTTKTQITNSATCCCFASRSRRSRPGLKIPSY